jgi:hypothetical protein
MASPVVDRVWHDTAPGDIEDTLAALWRETGRRAPVARAVMSNLVVVRSCDATEPIGTFASTQEAAIDAIAAHHPSRVIVIAHEHGCPLAREPLAARVGVVTYGPADARYAVEQVSVRSSCDEVSLPSIVRRLTRGDLPTSVWCVDDFSQRPPLGAILAEARQIIYDSRHWTDVRAAIRGLETSLRGTGIDFADLNWRRLAPVRAALSAAPPPADVRIVHAPGESALAWLLGGWLASTSLHGTARVPPIVEDASLRRPLAIADVREEPVVDAIVDELRSLSRDAALRGALRALVDATSAASS